MFISSTNSLETKLRSLTNFQLQENYLSLIKENEGIIHKVIGLYTSIEEDKKDLYQEILLQAWRGFANFKASSKFSTWLYKVALNTAINYNKRNSKIRPVIPKEINESTQDDHELLYLIISSMNEIDKMLMTLHLDGYKHKEISELSGMSINNVTVKIHRLKKEIIEKFKRMTNGPTRS